MGGTSKTQSTQAQTQTQASTSDPWAPTQPALKAIMAQVQGQMGNAQMTGAEINQLAGDMLQGGTDRTGMVQGAYDDYKKSMTPYTTMDTNPYSNEAFTKATGYMSDDIGNRIKSQYAASGYSPTGVGDFGKSMGEGIARGVAPTWLDAYNTNENRKTGAIGDLYGAGNTTAGLLSGMDQTALGNRVAGVGDAQMANSGREEEFRRILEAEAMKRGIPLGNLAALSSLIVPMAQLGQQTTGTGTSTGNTQGTQQMSGAQQFATIAGGIGAMMPKFPIGIK